MQPVQDLSIEDRVSRTQYQYSIEDTDSNELAQWAPRLVEELKKLPQLRDVATDQQDQGLRANLVIDRDSAARLGILPAAIDQTLYDAFGQRQVSTMFTQLNQYHVILEVDPQFQQNPDALKDIYVKSSNGTQVPVQRVYPLRDIHVDSGGKSPGAVSGGDAFVQPGARIFPGRCRQRDSPVEAQIGLPASRPPQLSRHGAGVSVLARQRAAADSRGADHRIHRPGSSVRKLHSSVDDSFYAALRGSRRPARADVVHTEFSVIALIGIILLIGIVQKNAIMMIDFALDAERKEGKSPEEAIYQACLLRFRPIMMTTMAAMLGGLPLALGSGTGLELRRPLGISIVGGLVVSQMLTLFTTPVVYLWFDRLAQRFSGSRASKPSGAGLHGGLEPT